jgi:hypothetical protein
VEVVKEYSCLDPENLIHVVTCDCPINVYHLFVVIERVNDHKKRVASMPS